MINIRQTVLMLTIKLLRDWYLGPYPRSYHKVYIKSQFNWSTKRWSIIDGEGMYTRVVS